MVPSGVYYINWPGKSGHLDNLDTFCWSQDVHNTQVHCSHVLIIHKYLTVIVTTRVCHCHPLTALSCIHHVASVHLPRIGHSTPHFNWYGTERLIRKHLVMRRIPTFVYPLDIKHFPDVLSIIIIIMVNVLHTYVCSYVCALPVKCKLVNVICVRSSYLCSVNIP